MGLSGTLDYLSELVSMARKKKKRQLNTVALKVRMDCEGCALQMKKVLSAVKGAKSVEVNLKEQKATVYGFVEAKKVLKAAQETKKKVEPWPYVPYSMIAHPYAGGVYDKKAPPNFVRNTNEPGVATLNQESGDMRNSTAVSTNCLLHDKAQKPLEIKLYAKHIVQLICHEAE